jgi:pyruvate kinase
MTKTKLVCTIGPASKSEEVLREMANAGMNVTRMNMSHGDYESHASMIEMVKSISADHRWPIAILLDTKGPEIRTGKLEGGKVEMVRGDKIVLTTKDIVGTKDLISISYPGLVKEVRTGDRILLQDGTLELDVVAAKGNEIECSVAYGVVLGDNKGVAVPGVDLQLHTPTELDKKDIKFGIEQDVDFVALSFVRSAAEVREVRKFIRKNGGNQEVVSKIEHPDAYKNIDKIIQVSDGIMVARGDLGVVMPLHGVPLIQKEIIRKCNEAGKFVITATEMLDSMIRRPLPTRAEVTDVVNAILDGTDAIMLSGETAIGAYPIESVRMMRRLATEAEKILEPRKKPYEMNGSVENAVSFSATEVARGVNTKAIICCTFSGATARNVSKYRPRIPVYATTPNERVRRRLGLVWGVFPLKIPDCNDTDTLISESVKAFEKLGLVRMGDNVVITAGIPVGVAGTTNMVLVREVKDGLAGVSEEG